MKLHLKLSSLALCAASSLAVMTPACASSTDSFPTEEAESARDTYARVVLASYKDSLTLARQLDDAIEALVSDPSQDTLDAARTAWKAAREPYLQTEAYRFYDGPIDNAEDGPEGLLNAWPLDENYIDYTEDEPEAGIINDTSQELSKDALAGLNEQGGEKNIATGYHAIEFLLWGQDHSDDGPGNRPFTDYTTAENADRRGEYLNLVSDLLVENLEQLVDAWSEDEDNYRAEWDELSGSEALRRILTGILTLSGFETGGERIDTALESGDQEDEHSCFSDNTHRDMIQDIQGVKNVWDGHYETIDGDEIEGPSVRDVVEVRDPELADEIDDLIEHALEHGNELQPPFDQEISYANEAGRERVSELAQSLHDLADGLTLVFRAFDLDEPETE